MMMNKERFILCNKTTDSNVWDTWEKQCYGWEYVVSLLNEYSNENEKLKKVIDLMEYQMKVHDRIIKEYEDGESNEL